MPPYKHHYKKVGADETLDFEDDNERTAGKFMAMFMTPQGRKIQNGVYALVMIAALITLTYYVDSSAAFEITFSSTASAWNEGQFQIEWLSVAIAGVSLVYYAWNTLNYDNYYEQGVQAGFCYFRWVHFSLVSAMILAQLYVMECYGDQNGIIALILAVFWIADSLGSQEETNSVYHDYEDIQETKGMDADVTEIRRKRWRRYLRSFAPVVGVIGIVFSQAVYYGIKGVGSMPTLFKVYIGLDLGFLLAISALSAMHNFRWGRFARHADFEGMFLLLVFAWIVIALVIVPYTMHYNGNLSYCESTPVGTVN